MQTWANHAPLQRVNTESSKLGLKTLTIMEAVPKTCVEAHVKLNGKRSVNGTRRNCDHTDLFFWFRSQISLDKPSCWAKGRRKEIMTLRNVGEHPNISYFSNKFPSTARGDTHQDWTPSCTVPAITVATIWTGLVNVVPQKSSANILDTRTSVVGGPMKGDTDDTRKPRTTRKYLHVATVTLTSQSREDDKT